MATSKPAAISTTLTDVTLLAKRIVVADIEIRPPTVVDVPEFEFVGEPTLELEAGIAGNVIDQKLNKAGLVDQTDYMRGRARSAEYNLIKDVHRRPDAFPKLLVQIEQRVYGEAMEPGMSRLMLRKGKRRCPP